LAKGLRRASVGGIEVEQDADAPLLPRLLLGAGDERCREARHGEGDDERHTAARHTFDPSDGTNESSNDVVEVIARHHYHR